MQQTDPRFDRERWEMLARRASEGKGLVSALAGASYMQYTREYRQKLWESLTAVYGKQPSEIEPHEFLCGKLTDAFASLAGEEMADKLPELVAMRLEGQLSSSPYRRSYRSKHFGCYAGEMSAFLCELVRLSCYRVSVRELVQSGGLRDGQVHLSACVGISYLIALEIRRNNEEIISLLREAILGDNTAAVLTRQAIEGVILSGNEELLCDLERLLLAAKLQEGVRQQILEAADMGSVEVFTRFLKLCIEEDLLRFSGVCRAFFTWTGMGEIEEKPQAVKTWGRYAYDCLTDRTIRAEYAESEDNTKAYFAFWAMGCIEYRDALRAVRCLLTDEKKYRRVLGWYFVSHAENPQYQRTLATGFLDETDEELLAWIFCNLCAYDLSIGAGYGEPTGGRRPRINPSLPEKKAERVRLFAKLKDCALSVGNKKRTFKGNPFPFVSVSLDSEPAYRCMMALAGYDMDDELIEELLALAPHMGSELRLVLMTWYLLPDSIPSHRAFLQNALNDRSVYNKEKAVMLLSNCRLCETDLYLLADALRSKSSSFRKAVLSVFCKQKIELLAPVLKTLSESDVEYKNQAAIELLLQLKEQYPSLPEQNREALERLRSGGLSTQTEILLEQLLPKETKVSDYTPENGFGLYDPAELCGFTESLSACTVKKQGFFEKLLGKKQENGLYSEKEMKELLPDKKETDQLLDRLDGVFTRHADFEYEVNDWGGGKSKVLFGDGGQFAFRLPVSCGYTNLSEKGARMEMVPFFGEFTEALGEYATDVRKAVALCHVLSEYTDRPMYLVSGGVPLWFLPVSAKNLAPNYRKPPHQAYGHFHQINDLIEALPTVFDTDVFFAEAFKWYRSMLAVIGEENVGREYDTLKPDPRFAVYGSSEPKAVAVNHPMLGTFREMIGRLSLSEEAFRIWFPVAYRLEKRANTRVRGALCMQDYFRACHLGLIPESAVTAYLLSADSPKSDLYVLTRRGDAEGRKLYDAYPWAESFVKRIVERIAEVEQRRGELATPLSQKAVAIEYFEGAAFFCSLLAALGKENFFRGYVYVATTKNEVLSLLLKRCYPAPTDTPEGLKTLLKQTDISEKRLAEAAMYAPQWAGFAERILGWDGLKCGVWFFHAHINETFSAEKETEIALFSPISPVQFNDGAFDKNWFFEAYGRLGEKRFQTLYRCAKYITSGNSQHRRSQLYVDAVLGRLDAEELKREITEKRNQEKLRCYPLLPLAKGDQREALSRYEFICRFQKESRQFGAQRRESEKKACATALENLAVTMGIPDVNRLIWQMEGQKLQEILPLTKPVTVCGVSLRLAIDEEGKASVAMEKDGKTVKTPPKALAKEEVYLHLKETAKELKEQKRRSAESLERAMTESTLFPRGELAGLLQNPVLAPMAGKLVWISGEAFGFPVSDGEQIFLEAADGTRKCAGETLRLAHPYDLRAAGNWAEFMRCLYEKRCIQPFKQVFREFYPITEDELQERTVSRRYAGHQVQPRRAGALLKSRGWTVDYEEGLQRVFYREDLVVRMYALADWFSPSDIEAPTLETVEFFDRKTNQNVPLEQISPILFSETMRDLDLTVSVAHVGGVDPEASHSTVEMRIAVAKELVSLFRLQNVEWIGSHAKIRGKLANYSVHMGSGVVHAEGVGMLAVLPVHSQARGRIFLPFADEDPKTAEIMSKILLLAEDDKIKDPSVLSQIK